MSSDDVLFDRDDLAAALAAELRGLNVGDLVRAAIRGERRAERARADAAWQARVQSLQEAGPAFAEAKRLIIADAHRRGVMHQVRWIDIGLPSGNLWPVLPPRFDSGEIEGGVSLQSGSSFRQRR